MESFEKIKQLRILDGKTTYDISEATGIPQSTISKIENNKRKLEPDVLKILSNYFNVSYNFLLDNSVTDSCPECGFEYCPLEKEDFEEHKIRHNNFLNFPDKDLFLTYSDREVLKRKSYEILHNINSTILEKAEAAIKLYQCWYARSIGESNFDINHSSFSDYIAMMLNRSDSKEDLTEPVYNLLVEKYGLKEGIADGKSYYDFNKNELSKKAEKDIQKALNETLGMLQNSQSGLMFDGEPIDDLTRELLAQSLENSMRMAKKIAKEKYTPKKYKK